MGMVPALCACVFASVGALNSIAVLVFQKGSLSVYVSWVFVVAQLSSPGEQGTTLQLQCAGLLQWFLLPGEHGLPGTRAFRSCGTCLSSCGSPKLWSTGSAVVPWHGTFLDQNQTLFLALRGGLFITEPPGKPNISLLLTKGASLIHHSFINYSNIHLFHKYVLIFYPKEYFIPKSAWTQQ